MTQFYGKTKICYGKNSLETIESLPSKQAFLVADPFMVKAGFIDHVKSHLDIVGIKHETFDAVEPDPSLQTVISGTKLFLKSKADMIIALGGGSAIDTAKGIMYFGYKANDSQNKPLLVAIPTSSGTGSEVTAISVITDTENKVKIPLNDEFLIPDVAILDARFTRTLPPSATAATGMDALTHAIEAYTSRQRNIFTSLYAKQAIQDVFSYLYRAYCVMDDMEAREALLLGSCMAGMAFTNSGLGITHSISHSLGGLFHIPHGSSNAVLLPHVIRFNSFDTGTLYREIAEFVGLSASTVEEGVNSLVQAVTDLSASMKIPARLRDFKIDESAFRSSMDAIAVNALADICTTGNAKRPSHEDIKGILERAW